MESVGQLMAERQKYEKWLRDLDAKRGSTPPKVFQKVHADYSERLKEVTDGLRQHTSALQEHARGLMIRLKELEVSEEELIEEQSENELRSQVGEITEEEWESSKKKAVRMVAKFKEDQEQLADDLNQIREILADAAGQPTDTPPQGMPRTSTDFDELAFLKSVVGQPTPQSSTPNTSRPSQPKVAVPAVSEQKAATETPIETDVVEAAQEPAPSQPKAAESMIEQPKPTERLTGKVGMPGTSANVQSIPDGPASIRTSHVSESQKTLKCAECGAMNYPSEWYCERCGAELANI